MTFHFYEERLRSCAFLIAVNTVGVFYFSLLVIHAFLIHFPSSPEAIISALSVFLFCAGAIIWNLSSISYRAIAVLQHHDSVHWQRIEFCGAFVFISAASIHFTALEFTSQPWICIGYVSMIVLAAVECLANYLMIGPTDPGQRRSFGYDVKSLIMLALMPVLHAVNRSSTPAPLVLQFGRLLAYNILGALHYLLRPIERLRLATGWRPSLYAMHIIMTYSAIVYSKAMLCSVLEGHV